MIDDRKNKNCDWSEDNPQVFVVDDNEMVGELVENILRMESYYCRVFEDPREALAAFRNARLKPELLLTDFVMDYMNGMELIQDCKKIDDSVITLLYSGNVKEDCVRGYEFAPDHFLAKPFTPSDLFDLIERLLGAPQKV